MEKSIFSIDEVRNLDMRSVVGYSISKLHTVYSQIVVAYADVGSRFSIKGNIEPAELEVGIAEQSLIPILGGMAHEGLSPIGIAYAPFITMRAADQIRMTIGEMNLPIILVGGSAGLVSGNLGAASLALDDIALMRAIPNLSIFSPSDSFMMARMIETAVEIKRPVYIRATGNSLGQTIEEKDTVDVFKYRTIYSEGSDAIIYATGASVFEAYVAAQKLYEKSIKITVVDVTSIKPLDVETLKYYSNIKYVFTVEEHNIMGGMGSAIAEHISENYVQKVVRLGVQDTYLYPEEYRKLLVASKIDATGIEESILRYLKKIREI